MSANIMNILNVNLVGVVSFHSSNEICSCGLPILTKSNKFNKIALFNDNTAAHLSCTEEDRKVHIKKIYNDEAETILVMEN